MIDKIEGYGVVTTIEWTVTTVTEKVIEFARKIFEFIFKLPALFVESITNGVTQLLPQYNKGMIPPAILGSAVGTYFSFIYRKAAMDGLISTVTGAACNILGKTEFATKVAKAGMCTLYSIEQSHVVFVIGGGVLTGVAFLLVEGVVYQLLFNNPAQKKIIDHLQEAQEDALDHAVDIEAQNWLLTSPEQPSFSGDPN